MDVSNLTEFTVNNGAGPLRNTATFGAGLRLGQLYLMMYLEANSLFPAGVCPWVGTAGHILGVFLSRGIFSQTYASYHIADLEVD